MLLTTDWFYFIVTARLVLWLSSLHTIWRKFSDLRHQTLLLCFNLQPFSRFYLAWLLLPAIYQWHHHINRDLTFMSLLLPLIIHLLPLQNMFPRLFLVHQHLHIPLLISVVCILGLNLIQQLPFMLCQGVYLDFLSFQLDFKLPFLARNGLLHNRCLFLPTLKFLPMKFLLF